MLRGLQEVERDLRDLGIPFKVLSGNPVDEVPSFLRRHEGCALVTDFSPLRTGRAWKSAVGEKLSSTPFYEVDAHNIVPVWVASDKQEVGARTIRKKINEKLPMWLKDFPPLEPQPIEPPLHAQAVAAPLPAEDTSGIISPVPPAPSSTSDRTSVLDEGTLMALSAQLEAAVVASPLDLATAERVLGQLEGVRIDRALLKATGVGKAANELAKAKCDLSTRARPSGSARSLALPRHPSASLLGECVAPTDWTALEKSLVIDRNVKQVDWLLPGPAAAREAVHAFCASRLALFADKRNDPNVHAHSDLSPYLHFGQLSAQRMALMVQAAVAAKPQAALQAGLESFLEESIVRRELSDNFCFYNPNYDNLNGAAGWARESLELHAADKREHVYTLKQLEEAQTHEDIWNAAQRQMARTGKMHGFMRMYWAQEDSPALIASD
ncbi:deoxyribodipyrimidine photo-lyase-like protein [Chrysochromulina tobinii]|uniref:Deoxyribodipyrimidine photo-lyase-like protein n=1 Tax=Chrysochromulina tobinii TaxID=1460289 RepID=A0A0M0JKG1_9EUKA|nr:deoxyribodipyrimidine photo-lyase-like protein [Chrysochromulina tobinii]|eukprot:KOO26945.1 deoxyribodipyrimidine photo-lyase-like protein [Chrysochromulina sp. CCMP291]